MRLIDVGELINNINEFAECVKAGSEFTRGYIAAHKVFAKLLAEQPTIEQPTWISCAERLPDDGEVVLAWVAPCRDLQFCYGVELEDIEATHWMPIPQPPKGG